MKSAKLSNVPNRIAAPKMLTAVENINKTATIDEIII
jgi:hypothetical protein